MKVVNIMPCRYPLKEHEWPLSMKAGVERCGDRAIISQAADKSDAHVFWGLRRPWGREAIRRGLTSIIVERAYLGNRFNWLAFGLNGLNGFADFKTENVPDDRWRRFWRSDVKDWKINGEYALVIGQVPGDASLAGLNIFEWLARVIPRVKNHYGKVVFRPHPNARNKRALHLFLMKNKKILKDVRIDSAPLQESLSKAKVVVTYSSNCAVDAVMAGVPAIAFSKGSMAYEVASHNLQEPLFRGDRDDWGRKIAYSQWLPEEVRNGDPWERIKEFI